MGERYSFFLKKDNDTTNENFWIHARFNQFCLADSNPDFQTDVMSILSYNSVYEIPTTSQTWQYDGGSPILLSTTIYNLCK